MGLHVLIELFGGPQDGREITLPASAADESLSPFPVPVPRAETIDGEVNTDPAQDDELEIAWYERYHRRGRGGWVYRYAYSHTVQPEWPWDCPAEWADSATD